jgi:hypothetical protein
MRSAELGQNPAGSITFYSVPSARKKLKLCPGRRCSLHQNPDSILNSGIKTKTTESKEKL